MKIKAAHISDLHIEEGSRLDECASLLDVFVEECRKAKLDLILVSGDIYHKKSTPAERLVASEAFRKMAEIAPVVGVRGNHDVWDDVEIFNRLQSTHPIWFAQRPHTYSLRSADILCVPWFDKANLVSMLEAEVDAAETTRRAIAAANQLLIALKGQADLTRSKGRIPIGLGHLMVAGSEVSTGQTIIGVTVELAPGDLLDVGCAYFAIGHVHKTQVWGNGRLAYAGSHYRQNFGEVEAKGFRLVEIEMIGDSCIVRNDFVELPARQIELYELGINDTLPKITPGALVRVRYRVRPQDLHLLDEQAVTLAIRSAGAADVKIEAVLEQETRIRSEQIVAARSTQEKVKAFWEAKQIDVSAETRGRVWEKLALIEA